MRFAAIHLPAYGPFTDTALDLNQGRGKLEIIYGPNEAGKSSLLRAICDFLFGIHPQTREDFLHAYANLRIRATLEREGKRLDCVRRKANSKSLRAANGDEVIEEEVFRWFFPIDNRDLFQTMFGLDSARLKQGGEELLKGGNQFGQMLFAAAAGIEGLHETLRKLNEEADCLFRPTARSTTIWKILANLKASKDRQRALQVSLTDWNQLQERQKAATEESSRLEAEILGRQGEEERYKRIQMSGGLLGSRASWREQLRGVEAARILRDEFASDHQKAVSGLAIESAKVMETARRVDELRIQIDEIVLPEDLLAREEEILGLHKETGSQNKAAKDRINLETKLGEAEAEIVQRLRSLGEPSDLERTPALVVRAADRSSVQELCVTRAGLDAQLRSGQKSTADATSMRDRAHRQLAELPAAKFVASLRGAAQHALQVGSAEEKLRKLQNEVAGETRRIAEDIIALPWLGGRESLRNSALPAEATVAEWTTRIDKSVQEVERAEEWLRTAQGEQSTVELRLAALRAGRLVPEVSQLLQERRHRDLGWRAVRDAWLEGSPDSEAARGFLPQPADSTALARAYEISVSNADATADILRTEAEFVAKTEQAKSDLDSARKAAAARLAELETAQSVAQRLQGEWAELWAPFQVPAAAPRQMAAWLVRRAALLARLNALREKEAQVDESRSEADGAMRRIEWCLAEIAVPATPEPTTLAGWRSLAEKAIETEDNLAKQREKLSDTIEAGSRDLATAEAGLSQASADLEAWKTRWTAVTIHLGVPVETETAAALEIIRIRDELQVHLGKVIDLKGRITGIDRDAIRFQDQLRGLLAAVAPELASKPELDAVAELYQRLDKARQQRELAANRTADLEREKKTLAKAGEGRKRAENLLVALAAEAQCEEVANLPGMIERSASRKYLEQKIEDIEQQLGTIGAGRGIAELEDEARGIEPDLIPGHLENISRQRDDSRARLKLAEESRITLENQLKAMEENADCCGASADAEAYKAEALEAVEQFIRIQLARTVLQGAVEQYRDSSQSDMLQRSSAQFELLTGGSFTGLKLDWDESGGAVLVGVRGQTGGGVGLPGSSVGLPGMSEGTRDQLYLALRLASMELYSRDHEPIPFVLDDILVQFDDQRASAAIRALADLAQHTQVLLFTHHSHVVELARANLPESRLAILPIACRESTIGASASTMSR